MRRLLRVVPLALLLAVSNASAQRELPPVDEAAAQPDFFTFRAHLLAAIVRQDREALLSVVHENIKNSFGGNDGIAEFKNVWEIDSPDSRVWFRLGTVLALGGTFEENGTFVAPYTFSRWPKEFDAFDHIAVIGSNVRVRSVPRRDAPVLTRVSFCILETLPPKQSNGGWVAVRLPDGQTGYIAEKFARSPIDYRAIFQKQEGGWRLIVFLAGD